MEMEMNGENNVEKKEPTMEELLGEAGDVKTGDVVKGRIIQIGNDYILVDIGYKSEGNLDTNEFQSEELSQFNVGDEIDVVITRKYDKEVGGPRVSYKQAIKKCDFRDIEQAYKSQTEIKVKLIKKVKGGVATDLKGFTKESMEAFMPASHISYPPVKDINSVIGKTVPARIIEYNPGKDNIVVSWRLMVESSVKKIREELLESLNVDDVVKGTVSKITKFGAFIDLGGIDGLLHIGDISWGHIKKVEDVLKVGEELEVKVLDFVPEKEKISLGLKQLSPHPWDDIEEKYPVGSIMSGRVSGLTSFGAFVEFAEGVEGMIHVSDMSWTSKVRKPADILKEGEIVETKVLRIDPEKNKMALGLKQIQPNPWEKAKERYQPDDRLTGTITHLAPFGAFVKLEEGIEGMIHVSDMSWTKNINHPKDALTVGEQVEVVVLRVSVEDEKISLGLKQKSENPYDKYHVKSNVQAKIQKITKNGVFVELEQNMEGFIHISQISSQRTENVEDEVKEGEMVWASIMKVDPQKRKIELSIKEYHKSIEKAEVNKYINKDMGGMSIGDIMKAKEEDEEYEDGEVEDGSVKEEEKKEEEVKVEMKAEAVDKTGLQEETETEEKPEEKTDEDK